ncbi:class A beta-lactamase [Variovorax sp. WS11]|uniref:class A beta-lactamase n=1 Tax=Variovorax sp. WS11 TaxID=1105204 RepID=UPI000D0D7257|nr:class A beta-lactamase [Variovorax sp. WS11]NDZ16587.1 class A beta-lactamase [Variovorax sp. WS11]PSL85843.1 class A beta-lactamase [Variovorax sp. WS11]
MIHRRQFTGALLLPLAAASFDLRAESRPGLARQLAEIEKKVGGRLGVHVLDTADGRRAGHRQDERFALCSTFKFLAAALVLARVDQGKERLDRRVTYARDDLVPYSPATEKHAGGEGMTMAQLCEAAVTLSDNTAANLMLASFGGPAGLTAYMRSLGDTHTRLDRIEPGLNEARAEDPRDTTTPAAIVDSMQKTLLGNALAPASRVRLLQWLDDNKTGGQRIRAGLPADWKVGDKTGTGENGATNDIAILRPPGRAPVLLSVYLTETKSSMADRNAAHAAVAAAAAAWVTGA